MSAREARVLTASGRAGQLAAGQKEEEHTDQMEYGLMDLSVFAAVVGLGGLPILYERAGKDYPEPIAVAPRRSIRLYNKWFVDEGYDYIFTGRRKVGKVRLGVMGAGEASSWFDAKSSTEPSTTPAGSRARSPRFPLGGISG